MEKHGWMRAAMDWRLLDGRRISSKRSSEGGREGDGGKENNEWIIDDGVSVCLPVCLSACDGACDCSSPLAALHRISQCCISGVLQSVGR